MDHGVAIRAQRNEITHGINRSLVRCVSKWFQVVYVDEAAPEIGVLFSEVQVACCATNTVVFDARLSRFGVTLDPRGDYVIARTF
jgi:hypothetical protein